MRDNSIEPKKRSHHFDKERRRRKLAARNKAKRKAVRKLTRLRMARR